MNIDVGIKIYPAGNSRRCVLQSSAASSRVSWEYVKSWKKILTVHT